MSGRIHGRAIAAWRGISSRLAARGVSSLVILAALVWGTLVVAALAISRITGNEVYTCSFRRVTGYPCATCGGTRAAERLFRGDLFGAIAFNPLATAVVIGTPLLLLWWIAVPHPPPLPPPTTPRKRRLPMWAAVLMLIVIVAANWAYVLSRG
ncbi:MAG: DUF2752 domain-containing protein [Phycisphaeraceae bacterium]|nr:DUF2752 domain-containing protein [Phycisphaeraceae bacterium]